MKEIIVNNKTYLFVEVPDNAYNFSNILHSAQIDFLQNIPYKKSFLIFHDAIILRDYYNDKFEIISTTKNITEEQAENIVESVTLEDVRNERRNGTGEIKHYFENYLNEQVPKITAKESLQSLIQANGLDIKKNYLIMLKR